jgi:glycosyltransferase involved in cell wall biosynthesis
MVKGEKCAKGRIAIFVPNLGGGGAERVMVMLANGIAARGLQVDLVLAQRAGPYLDLVSPEVRIVDLQSPRVLQSIPALARYLWNCEPDALLSALSHANIAAIVATRLARVRTRVIVSDRVSYLGYVQNEPGFGDRVIRRLMRALYPKADGVVTVSRDMIEEQVTHLRIPREHLYSIWNPVVDDAIRGKADLPPEFWPHSLQGRPVVLAAGRLNHQKGFATLIEAFDQVRREVDASLVIVGEGELRSELEDIVAARGLTERVFLPGFVGNPFALMSRADLFVLSSRFEGLPGTLIQAMACGTQVISTDCPTGPREILEDGKWGRLVPVDDAQSLAGAIIEALRSEEKPDVVRRADDFRIEPAIDAYLAVLVPD